MEASLHWLPGWQLREVMAKGEVSPVEVVRHFLDRIELLDPVFHSFITVAAEQAVTRARAAERAIVAGEKLGLLFGVPVSLKDLLWTRSIRTTAGSAIYRDYRPPEDSVHAERVENAGGIIIGKTNTPEFGYSLRTKNLLVDECLNPWDKSRTSGGSSGGAAVSVAAGLCPIGIGGDSAGSIRIPAAFCGVFGLQPSDGRVPRHGDFGELLFFSGTGPITRDVRDAALLLQVLAGPDPRDPLAASESPPYYLNTLEDGVQGVCMGWIGHFGSPGRVRVDVIEAVKRAALAFEKAGACVEEVNVSLEVEALLEAFSVMARADAFAGLGREVYENPSTRELLTPYAREYFSRARLLTAGEYSRAIRKRAKFVRFLESLFQKYQILLTPTVGHVAPTLAELSGFRVTEDHAAYVIYTFLVNFAGHTAASVPCGFIDRLPIGLQIIAAPKREELVLRASRTFEIIQPWAHNYRTLLGD